MSLGFDSLIPQSRRFSSTTPPPDAQPCLGGFANARPTASGSFVVTDFDRDGLGGSGIWALTIF